VTVNDRRIMMPLSERRLEELTADPASALVEIGEELRRIEQLGAS
jgi:hypothetical protein